MVSSPHPSSPHASGPHASGPEPSRRPTLSHPDLADPNLTSPNPAGSDPAGSDPAGSDPAGSDPADPRAASGHTAAPSKPRPVRPPLWLGLFVLLVLPFLVLAAVIHRGAVLGTPPDAVLLTNGQSFISDGERVDLYVPISVSGVDQCRLFDEDNRVLSTGVPRDSLNTEVGQVGYTSVLSYRAQPGTVITVGCALSPTVTLVVTPPITRQSVLLPLTVGGVLGFVTIGVGTAMLVARRRRVIARATARRSAR